MKLNKNMLLTFIVLRAGWALAFGLEDLLCRHNEPGSEQCDGPKTQGLVLFPFMIMVRDFSPVQSRVIACHDYAILVDWVF